MISDLIIGIVGDHLEDAGFTVLRDYAGEITDVTGASYPAFVGVKSIGLSEYTVTGTDRCECRAEITLRIRALGNTRGFGGAELLSAMTETAAMDIFFSSEMIIKELSCGEIKKNMSLGRLEQLLELTVVTALGTGGGDSEEEVGDNNENEGGGE